MLTEIEKVLPSEIEKRSFEIIAEELGDKQLIPGTESIVKRCIHTSADFDYADNLIFSENVVEKALKAIRGGASIVTDTQMGKAGINKKCLAGYGGEVYCFMSDDDVAQAAKRNKTTRAAASMDKAAKLGEQVIFAIGNAPTALVRLYELIKEEKIAPELVIAVPVGFVNVVQSKELILSLENTPYIVARGRKGGSNIAACICNALLYMGDGGKKRMKKPYFPMFVDLSGRQVTVVGGGSVALRRSETLLYFGVDIKVIAPEIRSEFYRLDSEGKLFCVTENIRKGMQKEQIL